MFLLYFTPFLSPFHIAPEGKDNTGGLVVLDLLVSSLVNLKVKDHCCYFHQVNTVCTVDQGADSMPL